MRPTRWGEERCTPASTCTEERCRRFRTPRRDPCGDRPRDRGTCPARRTSGGRRPRQPPCTGPPAPRWPATWVRSRWGCSGASPFVPVRLMRRPPPAADRAVSIRGASQRRPEVRRHSGAASIVQPSPAPAGEGRPAVPGLSPLGRHGPLKLGLVHLGTARDTELPGLVVELLLGPPFGPSGSGPQASPPGGGNVLDGGTRFGLGLPGARSLFLDRSGGDLLGPSGRRSPLPCSLLDVLVFPLLLFRPLL